MNRSKKFGSTIDTSLNREAKITVLSLLKNFYDEQIFRILIKDFYDSDIDVSLSAIEASASIGNEVAMPHLYRILEKGKPSQQKAVIQTLAVINAPSSIDKLAKYFNIFQGLEVRKKILETINKISPFHPRVRELNKSVLSDPGKQKDFYEIVMPGLLESGEIDLIKIHFNKLPPDVQRIIFTKLLQSSSHEVSAFIEYYKERAVDFDPHTLGCYLSAYALKSENPQLNFLLETLTNADPKAMTSFLITISDYNGRIQHPIKIFRLLLRVSYIDQETEALNGDFLVKIVKEVKSHSPLLLNEFTFTTATHLEAVLGKVRKLNISLKGVKERESLLIVILAKIIERYSPPDLLQEIQGYFKTETPGNPASIVQNIRNLLKTASIDDQNRFEACVPLFMISDRKVRLTISHTLSKISLESHSLMHRLNRLIRVIGTLEVRNSGKKILEILKFAREERYEFLEETSVVTLCQLLNRTVIEQAKAVFAESEKYAPSVLGYIRGARFVPSRIFISSLLKFLLNPGISTSTQVLIVDSIKQMDLQGLREIRPPLIRALKLPEIDNNIKKEISEILAQYGDSSLLQPILDLTGSSDSFIRQIGIRTLRALAKKEKNIPIDVLTNRLYLLLEDSIKSVQVEALLTLLILKDDYAIQILEDYVNSKDEAVIVDLLKNLEKPISHEVLSHLLKLIYSDSAAIQQELRKNLPQFCEGDLSEEIRKALLDHLKSKTDIGLRAAVPAGIKEATISSHGLITDQPEGLIEHAKLEFKFRRENSQILTVFFIDIVSYTEKSSASDTSTLIKLIQSFEGICIPTITNLRGTLIKKMGDGLLATFKHPLNAALASLTIHKKIKEHNQYKVEEEKFNVRIGLNTGLVIRKDSDIYGDTVNVASRMQTTANPGDVLLTQNTYEEIKEYVRCTRLGDIQVKGKEEAITAYSAEEIMVDIENLLAESKEDTDESLNIDESGSLAKLRESIFSPEFKIPDNLQHGGQNILTALKSLFQDMTGAAENIARDYYEEYVFKKYLQAKWDEVMALWDKVRV